MGAHSAPHKKSFLLLPLIAVAAVAVLGWWFMFARDTRSSDPGGPSSAPRTGEISAADPATSAGLQKRSTTGTVETLEVFASRDPFAPLVGDNDHGPDGGSGQQLVRLKAVAGSGAQVDVDGETYSVAEEEVFGVHFKLLSISGDCASMLFGDDQFTICEGEEILK